MREIRIEIEDHEDVDFDEAYTMLREAMSEYLPTDLYTWRMWEVDK